MSRRPLRVTSTNKRKYRLEAAVSHYLTFYVSTAVTEEWNGLQNNKRQPRILTPKNSRNIVHWSSETQTATTKAYISSRKQI